MTPLRVVLFAILVAVAVAACGKRGGLPSAVPSPGVYHLEDGPDATSLELRPDGTFTVHRESCEGIGDLDCGRWRLETVSPTGTVMTRASLYWPTPEAYPSTVFRRLEIHGDDVGDLVVVGESEWAGVFSQRWRRGRVCQVCAPSSAGAARAQPCDAPLPACTTPAP